MFALSAYRFSVHLLTLFFQKFFDFAGSLFVLLYGTFTALLLFLLYVPVLFFGKIRAEILQLDQGISNAAKNGNCRPGSEIVLFSPRLDNEYTYGISVSFFVVDKAKKELL
jgi:hypothetical protein